MMETYSFFFFPPSRSLESELTEIRRLTEP